MPVFPSFYPSLFSFLFIFILIPTFSILLHFSLPFTFNIYLSLILTLLSLTPFSSSPSLFIHTFNILILTLLSLFLSFPSLAFLFPNKVTPRKRFKCPTCTNDGLFADSAHFRERNQCINLFAKHFGGIPLKAIKYRLDPVLYKVKSSTEQAFPNIGGL